MNLNRVQLAGNLTRDPELKYLQSGTAVTNMNMAINRKYKSGEEMKEDVCFVRIVVWARRAEVCAEYLKKGSPVFVEGRLQSRSWEQDGQKRYAMDVVADNVQFLGGNKKKEEPKEAEAPPESMNL